MKILDWLAIAPVCLFTVLALVSHVDASVQRHNALAARQDSILAYLEHNLLRLDTLEVQMGYATGKW